MQTAALQITQLVMPASVRITITEFSEVRDQRTRANLVQNGAITAIDVTARPRLAGQVPVQTVSATLRECVTEFASMLQPSALTISSVIFLASPSSIIVLSM